MAGVRPPPGHFVLLYFASAHTCTGRESEFFSAPMTIAELCKRLQLQYPGIGKILQSSTLTINLDYVPDNAASTAIQEGDEIAIIPPVSSG
ncbi:hypothetical protein ANO11243_031520 [Dothideomycetidae sp. 11243]|nr:hypothetical protein ANO11243_031520 [fungal sp. No.11243]